MEALTGRMWPDIQIVESFGKAPPAADAERPKHAVNQPHKRDHSRRCYLTVLCRWSPHQLSLTSTPASAREAWEDSGYPVRGAAHSDIAAEKLESGSGIASRTIASLEHQWGQGRNPLTGRDVLVIDEAGMIGSRQMERVLSAGEAAGAKVVLVGDPEQLQAIEAGAAFRSLAERHGAIEITQIRRQGEDWQRDATRQLATG